MEMTLKMLEIDFVNLHGFFNFLLNHFIRIMFFLLFFVFFTVWRSRSSNYSQNLEPYLLVAKLGVKLS